MSKSKRPKQTAKPSASKKRPSGGSPTPDQALDASSRETIQQQLEDIHSAAVEVDQLELADAAGCYLKLLQITDCLQDDTEDSKKQLAELWTFFNTHLPTVLGHANGSCDDLNKLVHVTTDMREKWGDSLALFGETIETEPIDSGGDPLPEQDDDHLVEPSSDQIDLLLSVLQQNDAREVSPGGSAAKEAPTTTTKNSKSPDPQALDADARRVPAAPATLELPPELMADADLRDAFLDDANRCLAAMESVVLDAKTSDDDAARAQTFCRQLHTLKGASASVGLESLATYLHDLEEWLQSQGQQPHSRLDDDLLLTAIDSVRNQIAVLETGGQPVAPSESSPASPAAHRDSLVANPMIGVGPMSGESSIRVRASQLDRLMDMLAELVVIRNRRETWVSDLAQCNKELGHCSNRLRRFSDEWTGGVRAASRRTEQSCERVSLVLDSEPSSNNVIREVASDVAAISRELTDTYKPLAAENQALSHLIRQFRQELMQLRRLPVAGLFQRLKRSIRDAARMEQKSVEIRFQGEDTGLEQSLQERLYEPLLHVVRNAVSHGIEEPARRTAANKPPQGSISLRATASASLLVITVSDDGKGLDFEALRRRGLERGLLPTGSSPSKQQLAKLIFHPGFSTRESASQVSGRGVGMDVVATAIDRLQGQIDIDSETGQGTTVRLSIPLTTGIEHVMVFRASGRLFALPMRSITAANKPLTPESSVKLVSFSESMNMVPTHQGDGAQPHSAQTLMLDDEFGLRVDEVLGPDEVVVRALPGVVRRHPLLSGVVLSGSGETVLLLNADRTVQWCRDREGAEADSPHVVAQTPLPVHATPHVLIVDDSLSARKSLAKRLRGRGFNVAEAGDGLDALSRLRTDDFDLVLTDLDMPRMGGLELLSEINQSDFINAPVVVVSSRSNDEVGQRVSDNGAKAFLNKPVSEDSLTDLLGQLDLTRPSSPR